MAALNGGYLLRGIYRVNVPYELTISRYMALADVDAGSFTPRPAAAVAMEFRRQVTQMSLARVPAAFEVVAKCAATQGFRMEMQPDPNEGRGSPRADIFLMSAESPNVPADMKTGMTDHLIGLFASQNFLFQCGDEMEWLMRVRPSVTACALEREHGKPKAWWTFEGVPNFPELHRRPTKDEAASFLRATAVLAEAGIEPLMKGYASELPSPRKLTIRPERICINIADNNAANFGELVDVMNIDCADFANAQQGAFGDVAQAGANEVESFVGTLRPCGELYSGPALKMNPTLLGKAAVVSQFRDKPVEPQRVTVAGLAISSGSAGEPDETVSLEMQAIENEPSNLRAASAARPMSAMLANHEALRMDRALVPA